MITTCDRSSQQQQLVSSTSCRCNSCTSMLHAGVHIMLHATAGVKQESLLRVLTRALVCMLVLRFGAHRLSERDVLGPQRARIQILRLDDVHSAAAIGRHAIAGIALQQVATAVYA